MIESDVDIFCLQEVWRGNVQRRLRKELKAYYPYALSAIDLDTQPDNSGPACTSDEVNIVFTCQEQNCPGLSGPELVVCSIARYEIPL